ncbi:hypothetical protein [Pantoea agglomerans]|uniref:hypothetical protein n=1 Tax=Enterobacter agglomerans TaxID=549 RepID=UPI00320A4371
MAELKAGCQAMIIGGFYRTNDGKSVLVERFVPNGESFIYKGQLYADPIPLGDAWLVSGEIIVRDGETGEAKRMGFGLIPGKYLMPLDDDFTDEIQNQKELTT